MNVWYVRLCSAVGISIIGGTALGGQTPASVRVATSVESLEASSRVASVLTKPVTIRLVGVTLKQAVDAIGQKAGVLVQYQGHLLDNIARPITFQATQMPLGVALARVLAGTDLYVAPTMDDAVTIKRGGALVAASGIIVGKVIHAKTKQPVPGARVLLGETEKAVTSTDGTFRVSVTAGTHTINVRAVGFGRAGRSVAIGEGENIAIDIPLDPSASVLDEVVVTGTVVATERKAIPNPITVITAEEIEKRGITRIEQFFRGEVPGVLALELGSSVYNDVPGSMASSQMYARGTSGFIGSSRTNPLKTYVDGVELLDPTALGTIDPHSIERIEIVAGPQAATIYGSGAIGGVMQIFTKKGAGQRGPDITVRGQYGLLESNRTTGKTPTHNDAVSFTGVSGAEWSYNGSASYRYQGQWQPGLWSRSSGGSIGLLHTRGPVALNANVSLSYGSNGTKNGTGVTDLEVANMLDGTYKRETWGNNTSKRISRSNAFTLALNLDYNPGRFWQHHVTLGRNQMEFAIEPEAPNFEDFRDTLYWHSSSVGSSSTVNYNFSLLPSAIGVFSANFAFGISGSTGSRTEVRGTAASAYASTLTSPVVARPIDARSWGGFGRWQLGLFEHVYLTLGVRGERNPAYGSAHKIDWTPSNGIAYTLQVKEMTIKALASYGKATRAPSPEMRLSVLENRDPNYDPQLYVSQLEARDLRPEYSRGPQGGLELYFGNIGSLSVNHYKQDVDDLILRILADSIQRIYLPLVVPVYTWQYQYVNVASIRNQGWDITGSVNIWNLSVKGTYSWTDSKIRHMVYRGSGLSETEYSIGRSPVLIPTHTANLTIQYAHAGTSAILTSNIIGAHGDLGSYNAARMEGDFGRTPQYAGRRVWGWPYPARSVAGYVKSDLSLQHRLGRALTALVNITNVGNSFGNDVREGAMNPTVGRQTLLGLSWRR